MTELGNKLKEAREAKGLSLDDLQSITKIQKRYLQGIEEGNYSMMPGKFYVRAFIKQYAEAVGINQGELFETFKQEIPSAYDEQVPEQLSRVQTNKTIPRGNSKILDFLPKILIGVFVIGAAAVLYYFLPQNGDVDDKNQASEKTENVSFEDNTEKLKSAENSQKTAEDSKDKKAAADDKAEDKKSDKKDNSSKSDEKKQEEKPVQELTVVTAQGRETTYDLKNAEKFELKVATTGQTWVNILNGQGKSLFQGMLEVGKTDSQTFDLSADTQAVVVLGRSLDAQVFVNGEQLQYAVPPAQQVRQDITIRKVPNE